MNDPVVVGVDGSARGLTAVDVAAREAIRRHCPLRVVHAFAWPYLNVPLGPSSAGPPEGGLRHAAERVVSEAVDRARATGWGVPVTGELTVGWPAAVLANESRTASLVVLGDRGLGGFTGLLVGSVAVQVAAHAVCPVLVARGTAHRGDVLLGVDRSEANETAIGFAFEEAALRRTGLVAMHVWTYPVPGDRADGLPLIYDPDDAEADEDRALTEAIAPWQDKYPDVTVHRRLVRGRARPVLIDATRRARLVVVGSRGRGGFAGLLLGSVSQALLHHADCPVAIVPARAHPGGGAA